MAGRPRTTILPTFAPTSAASISTGWFCPEDEVAGEVPVVRRWRGLQLLRESQVASDKQRSIHLGLDKGKEMMR